MKTLFLLAISLILAACAGNSQTLQNQNLADIDTELMALDLQNHDPFSARLHLLDAETAAPNDPEVWVGEGYFDEAMDDPSGAEAAYTEAIHLAPQDSNVEDQYGRFLYQEGQYQAALSYFEKAGANPQNAVAVEADENAGFAAEKLKETTLAQTYFAKAEAGG